MPCRSRKNAMHSESREGDSYLIRVSYHFIKHKTSEERRTDLFAPEIPTIRSSGQRHLPFSPPAMPP